MSCGLLYDAECVPGWCTGAVVAAGDSGADPHQGWAQQKEDQHTHMHACVLIPLRHPHLLDNGGLTGTSSKLHHFNVEEYKKLGHFGLQVPFVMEGPDNLQDERPNEYVYKEKPNEIKPMRGFSRCLRSFYQFLEKSLVNEEPAFRRTPSELELSHPKLQTYCLRSAEANMLTQSNVNTNEMRPFCVRIFICNLRDS